MEFICVDISILFISVVLATVIFYFYAFSTRLPNSDNSCVENEKFVVAELVGALKRVCPIDSGNRWKLLPQNSGLSRCWGKLMQFPGFQANVYLYGAACAVSCSSMYAFSLIADVTKLSEWEPLLPSHSLSLMPFSDKELQRDKFMQAEQVVGIQRGTNVQSFVAMYRFMSFSVKTVKWILFWNAKELEFMFFLIQPAVSKTVDSQCLITHIFGSKKASRQVISVAQRLRNVKDFLILSQLHVIASKYTPAVPAISTSHSQTEKSAIVLKEQQPATVIPVSCSDFQHVFVLVPILSGVQFFMKGVKGFRLVVEKQQVEPEHGNKKQKKKKPAPKPPERLKRSTSDTNIKAKQHANNKGFHSSLELAPSSQNSDSTNQSSSLTKEISYVVEEDLKLDIIKKDSHESSPSSSDQKRSLSEPVVEYRKMASEGSEHQTDEDSFVSLHIIHENVQQESLSVSEYKNDVFCSSTSDFELVDSNQQFEDCRLADFLTQGNYGASELQAEMMLSSQFDKSSIYADHSSGCWMLHSTYKGISVLSKATTGQFMKILSFLCQIELPVCYKDVWRCVKNPRFRFFSDETVKTVKIVERISNSQKLIHVYHETSGFLKKECIDFCLLQTEREETNHFYSSFHSIEYEKCPLMTSVVRGSLRPSGWVVENLEPKRCKVTYLMQVIVSSPDSLFIQELNNLVPLAMHNLKNYTAAKPK